MAVKPTYRLETLRKLREHKKEDAEQHLARCLAALRTEQAKLRELEEELERMIAKREAKMREFAEKTMRGEVSAQDAITNNLYIDRLKDQEEAQQNSIEGQKAVIEQKEADVKAARDALRDAQQELEALEKHKEKWEDGVRKKREAKEEVAMDEIAQTIYLGNDKN